VAEVHAGLQQLPDPDFLSHGYVSLYRLVMRFPGEEERGTRRIGAPGRAASSERLGRPG
jgi:hypothetical protein